MRRAEGTLTEAGGGPQRVGDLVGTFLERKGLKDALARQEALVGWDEAVGEAIARVARPVRLDGTTLVVEVRSSAWLMELNMMKRKVLGRLNEAFPEAKLENLVLILSEDT